jgi:hypothetical protein
MSLYELDIGWVRSASERRYLYWELLACEDVLGVFRTARDETLAVLFSGDRHDFRAWARSFEPNATTTTRDKE